MRALNRSYWQHKSNVGFHLKVAATLSNQWGPSLGAILVLIPKKLFYWENVLRNPQVGLLIGLKKRCEYVRFTAQISRDLSWLK